MRRALSIVAFLAAACVRPRSEPQDRAPTLAGSWRTEGYGLAVEIAGDTALAVFEVTGISCLPSFQARATTAPEGALAAFRLTEAPLTFLVLPDSGPDRLRLHMNGAASDLVIRRVSARPPACERPPENTPGSNFEVFAATWAEQYGFFDLKGADWAAIVEANRPKVTDKTTPAEYSTS